jgi:hypothetical protein
VIAIVCRHIHQPQWWRRMVGTSPSYPFEEIWTRFPNIFLFCIPALPLMSSVWCYCPGRRALPRNETNKKRNGAHTQSQLSLSTRIAKQGKRNWPASDDYSWRAESLVSRGQVWPRGDFETDQRTDERTSDTPDLSQTMFTASVISRQPDQQLLRL